MAAQGKIILLIFCEGRIIRVRVVFEVRKYRHLIELIEINLFTIGINGSKGQSLSPAEFFYNPGINNLSKTRIS